jgi:serine/threonine protein kinase
MSSTPFVAPTLEALAALLPAYEFQAFIAQGGMGAVYKARQRSLDREVAIKVLPRELGEDPDFRKSFETEARAMARLNHPNLISVYDSGDVDGMLYIVMELVNGKSLYYSAYNLAVDPPQAVDIVKGICEGLDHAHENGVIHRDIKPANILLTPKREPKIGDFGLARPAGAEGPGLIMGTPGYTAPEILEHPEHADKRSDIYAVGVILYELLTGKKQEPNCPPPSSVAGCERALDTIWQNATHPNPAFRYPDAGKMARALAEWAAKSSATSPRKLVAAAAPAAAAQKRRALATPVAAGGPPAAPADAPPAAIPQVTVGTGNWNLVRNLVIIAGLVVAIAVTYKTLQASKTQREENNRITLEKEAERKARAAAEARAAAANPAPAPKPTDPPAPPPVTPEPPKPETAEESLARLKKELAAGKRDEMPVGTIRHGESDYLLIPTPMTWQQASAFARAHGGNLPLVAADEDITWMSSRVPPEAVGGNKDAALWIGAGRSGRNAWASVDGTPWKLKTPAGTGLFLAVDDLGLVRVRKPEDRYPFLIQWQRDGSQPADLATVLQRTRETLGQPVPVFPPGTIAYEARHLLVVLEPADIAQATAFAEMAGGHLAVPASRDEAGWLAEETAGVAADDGLWIGGVRDAGEWKWTTGEAWSFATWEDGFPTDSGDGLLLMPGKGWRDADISSPASGFIIEWSNDRENAESAPVKPQPRSGAGTGDSDDLPALADLNAKTRQLLAGIEKKRQDDLARNAKNLVANLDTWLRRQNGSTQEQWGDDVAELKQLVVDNRVPDAMDGSEGVSLSEDMAKFCSDAATKQQGIEAEFEASTTKLRDAYVNQLGKEAAKAAEAGQTTLARAIEEKADAAGMLAAWLESMGLTPPVASTGKAGTFAAQGSSFVGKWQLEGNNRITWQALADGSITASPGRDRQGTWKNVAGGVEVTWNDGRTLRFRKRGDGYEGEDQRGRELILKPAD